MPKGFGKSSKKKILKDARYLKFYNEEKLAKDLLKNKKIDTAKNIYFKLVQNGYQSFEVFYNLGFISIQEKKYQKAIKYLNDAKSLSKEMNLKLLFGLVNSHLALKDLKTARLILDESIENYPKSELLLFNYAKVEEDLFNYDKAIKLYEKGLILNPKNFKALSNLGGLYQKVNSYDRAIEIYKKAVDLQPDLIHLKISLVTCKAFACDWSDPKFTQNVLKNIDGMFKRFVRLRYCHLRIIPKIN